MVETELVKMKAEMEKLRASYDAAMAKQKSDHDAEVAKFAAELEEERERRAAEVLEAKAHALKVQRTHQNAQRDYRKAKTSCKLQAQRTKAMEAEGDRCIELLKEMDEQLSRKFLLRLSSAFELLRFTLTISSISLLSQVPFLPPMDVLPKLSRHFGRIEPKRPERNTRKLTLGGELRIGSIPCGLAFLQSDGGENKPAIWWKIVARRSGLTSQSPKISRR